MIVYTLVAFAVLASVVGIAMCWSTMVENKLVNRPAAAKAVPNLRSW